MTPPTTEAHLDTVQALAQEARTYVAKAIQTAPDGTDATLPLVDHYLGLVPRDSPEVVALVSASVGCYFGELLRARFHGLWHFEGQDPETWRLDLARGDVSLFPVAMTRQAMAAGTAPGLDDRVTVSPVLCKAVADALANLAPVDESVYYSLACRYDALETLVDLVVTLRGEPPA